jgi:hypothetical protein
MIRRRLQAIWTNAFSHPLGFPLTLRHYYFFKQELLGSKDGLTVPSAWDELRSQYAHFYLADERQAWLASFNEFNDG